MSYMLPLEMDSLEVLKSMVECKICKLTIKIENIWEKIAWSGEVNTPKQDKLWADKDKLQEELEKMEKVYGEIKDFMRCYESIDERLDDDE